MNDELLKFAVIVEKKVSLEGNVASSSSAESKKVHSQFLDSSMLMQMEALSKRYAAALVPSAELKDGGRN